MRRAVGVRVVSFMYLHVCRFVHPPPPSPPPPGWPSLGGGKGWQRLGFDLHSHLTHTGGHRAGCKTCCPRWSGPGGLGYAALEPAGWLAGRCRDTPTASGQFITHARREMGSGWGRLVVSLIQILPHLDWYFARASLVTLYVCVCAYNFPFEGVGGGEGVALGLLIRGTEQRL